MPWSVAPGNSSASRGLAVPLLTPALESTAAGNPMDLSAVTEAVKLQLPDSRPGFAAIAQIGVAFGKLHYCKLVHLK